MNLLKTEHFSRSSIRCTEMNQTLPQTASAFPGASSRISSTRQTSQSTTLTLSNLPAHAQVEVDSGADADLDPSEWANPTSTFTVTGGGHTLGQVVGAVAGIHNVYIDSNSTTQITFTCTGLQHTSDDWYVEFISVYVSTPIVTLAVTQADATEATDGNEYLDYRVAHDGSTMQSLDVALKAPWGDATNGVDYSTAPSTVTIPAGSLSTTFRLHVIDDEEAEGDESVLIALGDPGTRPYAPATTAPTTAAVHDNTTLKSIEVAHVGNPDIDAQGVSFKAKIILKGENVGGLELRQLMKTSTSWKKWTGQEMTVSEIRAECGGNLDAIDTGGAFVDGLDLE